MNTPHIPSCLEMGLALAGSMTEDAFDRCAEHFPSDNPNSPRIQRAYKWLERQPGKCGTVADFAKEFNMHVDSAGKFFYRLYACGQIRRRILFQIGGRGRSGLKYYIPEGRYGRG